MATTWSPDARQALRRALVAAGNDGGYWAGRRYLFDAILADPGNRAHALLSRCRVDPSMVRTATRADENVSAEDQPRLPVVESLQTFGVVPARNATRPSRLLARILTAGASRLADADPVLYVMEMEAIRQAVRLGNSRVTTAHLVLATLVLHEELVTAGPWEPETVGALGSAGAILAARGVTSFSVGRHLATLSSFGDAAPKQRHRAWRTNPKHPKWTVAAAQAAEATRNASPQGQEDVSAGTARLFVSALADADDDAVRMLHRLSIDPAAVVKEAERLIAPQ
ncbi:Clp protease N-terminal domain-containing protein [Planosporangium mesophilum]|uniref:Clp protease N-terminal domain-containing protein n=1 Tax=Planosporangium mesophilum TaxID=689768 RepID=UPI00143C8E94|nr:Clp protease N-terminal domain-containing protein [Planosporangium mesophilum]NJC81928.1 hypothetical protein [Planosporangium mesophilum]